MIHTSYTVGITTAEFLSLQNVMIDQQDWIENAIQNRARIAIDEIVNKYTQYKINKGEAVTAIGTTAVIEAAYAEGVVSIASTAPTPQGQDNHTLDIFKTIIYNIFNTTL